MPGAKFINTGHATRVVISAGQNSWSKKKSNCIIVIYDHRKICRDTKMVERVASPLIE